MKIPGDLKLILDDLKVCGRREFQVLLKLRHNYQHIKDAQAKAEHRANRKTVEVTEKTEEEKEAELDKELDATIARIDAAKKAKAKKDRVSAQKSELRKK